jgi:hypothetical protein
MRKKKKNKQKLNFKKRKAKSPQVKFQKKLERSGNKVIVELIIDSPSSGLPAKRSGNKVIVEPSGAVRMSEVLQDFAEPLLQDCVTDAEVKETIRFSMLVWNVSLMPTSDREKNIELLIENLAKTDQPEHIEAAKYYVDMLLKRKKIMFPDLNRIIVDCQFSGAGSKLRFDVASTL